MRRVPLQTLAAHTSEYTSDYHINGDSESHWSLLSYALVRASQPTSVPSVVVNTPYTDK